MNKLRELRKEKGDTQEVVAKAMGVTRRGTKNGKMKKAKSNQIKPNNWLTILE